MSEEASMTPSWGKPRSRAEGRKRGKRPIGSGPEEKVPREGAVPKEGKNQPAGPSSDGPPDAERGGKKKKKRETPRAEGEERGALFHSELPDGEKKESRPAAWSSLENRCERMKMKKTSLLQSDIGVRRRRKKNKKGILLVGAHSLAEDTETLRNFEIGG